MPVRLTGQPVQLQMQNVEMMVQGCYAYAKPPIMKNQTEPVYHVRFIEKHHYDKKERKYPLHSNIV